MKILIADDDAVSRRLLLGFAQRWGYQAVFAEDGETALNCLKSADAPRMALLDWMMPGRSGVEICREVRQMQRESYIYILLITANDAKESIVEGLESGADDYLTKPFHPQELLARIRVGMRLLELEDNLVKARESMRFRATHDILTGLWNRGAIMETLERELNRSRRQGHSVGVLIADLDHFKSVNDTYGHLIGDRVLREVAQRFQFAVRSYDFVGRYGGEEFLILMPDCARADTKANAERLRRSIMDSPIQTDSGPLSITVSMGAIATGNWPGLASKQVLLMADGALYRAKSFGRNCSVLAGEEENEAAQRAEDLHNPIESVKK